MESENGHGPLSQDLAGVISLERARAKAELGAKHCDRCGHVTKPHYRACPKCEGDRNRELLDRLARFCAQLRVRPPRPPGEEFDAERQLGALGHNFPRDFLKALLSEARNPKYQP
jgi:hypothetical protein